MTSYAEEVKEQLYRISGRLAAARDELAAAEVEHNEGKKRLLVVDEAHKYITLVAGSVQLQLEKAVSELVKLALSGVFGDDAYDFVMRFVPKAGKTDVEFVYVTKDGNELAPLEDSGIGTVDVTAFALRVSLWHLAAQGARPILLLDEPFKNISKEYRPTFLQLIKQMAKDTGLQFIIVTHQYDLVDIADNVITVTKPASKGASVVTCVAQ